MSSRKVGLVLAEKGYDVHSITPDTSVFEALERMAEHNVGALIVVDRDDVVGILSERDYARKVILLGRASRDTLVREVMTSDVITVDPDTTVGQCMQLMTARRIRHLPVLQDGRLMGVISIGDVVKSIMADQAFEIEQLQGYISGTA
jgi:CBS domain-containing protein